MLEGADMSRAPSVPKVFFGALDEAGTWLAAQRGPMGEGWKACAFCLPG
jgi:hypothetical protein